jgi:hypothetical protein
VPVLDDGVRHEGMCDQIKQLSLGSEAAGSPQVQVIVDLALRCFGVALMPELRHAPSS